MAVLLLTTAIFIIIIHYIYQKITTAHAYWNNKGIEGPHPHPIFGNMKKMVWSKTDNLVTLANEICGQYPEEKVIGIYQALTPILLVKDAKIAKKILINDFSSFTDRGLIQNVKKFNNLVLAEGDVWRMLRHALAPAFAVNRIKAMMPVLNSSVNQYVEYINNLVDKGPQDITKLNPLYTLKNITSVAFGLDVDIYNDAETEFEKVILKMQRRSIVHFVCMALFPELVDKLNIQLNVDAVKFFENVFNGIVEQRKGEKVVRNDFMDYLINLKEQGTATNAKDGMVDIEITNEMIVANALLFYFAGHETTHLTITYLLYELALHPEIQTRCHEEIDVLMHKYKAKLDYNALNELEYVSMVLDETLRKYPVSGVVFRQAVSDHKLEDIDLTIERGTKVWIPVYAIHRDAKNYPEPEKFDPERFSPGNKKNSTDIYMPFGDGPRNCLGFRFARIQVLLAIAYFLHKFRVSPCEKTPREVAFDPSVYLLMAPKEGLWLNIQKRSI